MENISSSANGILFDKKMNTLNMICHAKKVSLGTAKVNLKEDIQVLDFMLGNKTIVNLFIKTVKIIQYYNTGCQN